MLPTSNLSTTTDTLSSSTLRDTMDTVNNLLTGTLTTNTWRLTTEQRLSLMLLFFRTMTFLTNSRTGRTA